MLEGVVIDDAQVFNDKLREWEDFYNYHRPHGGLDGQTPYERLKQRTHTRPYRSSSVAHPAQQSMALTPAPSSAAMRVESRWIQAYALELDRALEARAPG